MARCSSKTNGLRDIDKLTPCLADFKHLLFNFDSVRVVFLRYGMSTKFPKESKRVFSLQPKWGRVVIWLLQTRYLLISRYNVFPSAKFGCLIKMMSWKKELTESTRPEMAR